MTKEEAIEEIRSCLGVNNIIMPYSDEMIAFGMAIEALEKQIPKRPYRCRTSGGQKGNMCPKCQRILTLGFPQHCEF